MPDGQSLATWLFGRLRGIFSPPTSRKHKRGNVATIPERIEPNHIIEFVVSGDVRLYCRKFGNGGSAPLLIMHGANYYDSYDWVDVASALSHDRMVVAFDQRGFGESDWSASRNYSVDTMMADIRAVIRHFGWTRTALLGHSASGRLAISFASHHPDLVGRLIVVDSAFGKDDDVSGTKGGGNTSGKIFSGVEEAMASFAKRSNPPRFAVDRERAMRALRPSPGGWVLKRDPHYRNAVPTDGASVRPVRELDVWGEMVRVECPTLIVRGLRSDRFVDTIIERIQQVRPDFEWVDIDARHDVAYEAPLPFVKVAQRFLATNEAVKMQSLCGSSIMPLHCKPQPS